MSHEIAKDFEDRRCLLRAFYIYITYNMKYDMRAWEETAKHRAMILSQKEHDRLDQKDIARMLWTKRGVCWHFGNLFAQLCAVQGIEVERIEGARKSDDLPEYLASTHLWNAVEIDGEMKMIDCTIKSDLPHQREDFDELFLVDPEVFIYSCYPENPEKQYLERPISYEAFKKMVWPHTMFTLLQVRDLMPRYKRLPPRRDGRAQINFKLTNQAKVDYLEVFVNDKLFKSLPVTKSAFSIALPNPIMGVVSIKAIKVNSGNKEKWDFLDLLNILILPNQVIRLLMTINNPKFHKNQVYEVR